MTDKNLQPNPDSNPPSFTEKSNDATPPVIGVIPLIVFIAVLVYWFN